MANNNKSESKDSMPDSWRKKKLIHFALLLWPQSVERRGTWRWKGQGNNIRKLVQWLGENSMKTGLKLLQVLFYPSDNLAQPIFHLHFRTCHQKKKGEETGQWRGMEKIFLFPSPSQKSGGNQMEQTHSQGELGAVSFIKTEFAADFSSTRSEPPFVKQILS